MIAPENDILPDPWKAKDIGKALKGGQLIDKNSWTFYGGGDDIWNSKDQFRFAYQKIKNDFELTIKVDSLKNTHPYAKAGLMIRRNLYDNSAHGIINFFPSGNTEYGFRVNNRETMQAVSGPSVDWSDARLKLNKIGNIVNFYVLKEDKWRKIGEMDISKWGKSFYVGIATLSHDNSQLTKAQYSDIVLEIY